MPSPVAEPSAIAGTFSRKLTKLSLLGRISVGPTLRGYLQALGDVGELKRLIIALLSYITAAIVMMIPQLVVRNRPNPSPQYSVPLQDVILDYAPVAERRFADPLLFLLLVSSILLSLSYQTQGRFRLLGSNKKGRI